MPATLRRILPLTIASILTLSGAHALADDWTKPTAEELQMTSEPAAPGAAAKPPSVPSGLPEPPDDADPGESSPAAAMIERHGGDDAFHRMVAGKTPADAEMGKLTEAWAKAYAHRRKQALRQLAPPKESE